MSINIFTYGTLMYKPIVNILLGHYDYENYPAVLEGFERMKVRWASYPGLVSAPGKKVNGILYLNVCEKDAERLHQY